MNAVSSKWFAAVLLLAGFLHCSLRAQEIPTEVRPGASITAGGGVSHYNIDYGQNALNGVEVYVDLNVTTHVGVEGEGRWLFLNQQANVHESTMLVGPRISFNSHLIGNLTPYVKVLVGDAKFNFPYNYATGSYFVLAPGAGIDLPVSQRFSIRLLDVEYQSWPQFTYGSLHPLGVSFGISYRILPRF